MLKKAFEKKLKAAGMLVYSEDAYKANLTTKQRNLIDALSKYVSVRARNHGFDDIAEDVDKHIEISNGILELLPKEKKRDKGMSR